MSEVQVILPWSGEPVTPDTPVFSERQRWCAHRNVRLDPSARRVYCTSCEREVDAFEALSNLASEWDRWQSACERARDDAVRAQERLDDLKRQVRNEQAKLRRRRA